MNAKLTKIIALLLCTVLVAGTLAACGNSSTQSGTTNENGQKYKDELVITMTADVKGFDPMKNWNGASYYLYWTVYERLFYLNPDTGKYEPELAKSWDISEDGKTITFHLQENVKWHDGTPFTAQDVKYTVERSIELGTGNYPGVDHVEVVDDHTAKFVFNEPESVFMDKQWTGDCCIIKDGTDEELAQHPMGTGPFKFVDWVSGDHVTIEAFEDYWGEKPKTKRIYFRIIPEANARLVALQTGEVDIAVLNAETANSVVSDDNLKLLSTVSTSVNYLGMNTSKAPFDNKLVRQAISYAIDKDAIVTAQLDGQGTAIKSFVAPAIKDFYDGFEGYTYDPAKAKELLTQAGYPNGFETTLAHSASANQLTVQLIQANLGDIGIKVKIDGMESATYSDITKAGETEMFVGGRSGGSADSYVMMFFSETMGPNGNIFFFANDRLDELYRKSHVTTDLKARFELYKEIQQIISDEAPCVPLYCGYQFMGTQKNVQTPYITAGGGIDFRQTFATMP